MCQKLQSSRLSVRRALPGDKPGVLALLVHAYAETEWHDAPYSHERAGKAYSALVDSENSEIFIALIDDHVIGLLIGVLEASYLCDTHDAVETLFYVKKDYRANAAANMLLDAFEEWAREVGAYRAQLRMTQMGRAEALATLFGRKGYSLCGFMHEKVL